MTKAKERRRPLSGVFAPGADLLESAGLREDLRGLFDRVHRHFFDSLGRTPGRGGRAFLRKRKPKGGDHD